MSGAREGKLAGAVAKRLQVVETEPMQQREHDVRHRRIFRRFDVHARLDGPAAAAQQNQRAIAMVVGVADRHRRSVEHEGLVQKTGLAVHRGLQLLEEVRQQRDVVLVDLAKLPDALLRRAVMRRVVEPAIDAALRIDAAGTVAADLEREHARRVRREREHLEIEHQLDVFVERIRHARRRTGQLAHVAAQVTGFDACDALTRSPGCWSST